MATQSITIEGEKLEVLSINGNIVDTEDGEFWVFESSETAGVKAREYWANMAQSDPSEFRVLVGDETLVRWALGQHAGPGNVQVSSLDEWLDLWLVDPEDHFASHNGSELDVSSSEGLGDDLGFVPGVAYKI